MQATHPNSMAAAKSHSHSKARTDRRLIVEFLANMAIDGGSDGDMERALVASGQINANAFRLRRSEVEERKPSDGPDVKRFGLITCALGLTKVNGNGKTVTVFHVTAKGLEALGRDPGAHWHSETKAA